MVLVTFCQIRYVLTPSVHNKLCLFAFKHNTQNLWWNIFILSSPTPLPPPLLTIYYRDPCYPWSIGITKIPCEANLLQFDVCWTVHHCNNWRIKNQLDATYYFIVLLIGSTCFRHYCAHYQELATVMLITTLVVSFLVCCRLEVRCS